MLFRSCYLFTCRGPCNREQCSNRWCIAYANLLIWVRTLGLHASGCVLSPYKTVMYYSLRKVWGLMNHTTPGRYCVIPALSRLALISAILSCRCGCGAMMTFPVRASYLRIISLRPSQGGICWDVYSSQLLHFILSNFIWFADRCDLRSN